MLRRLEKTTTQVYRSLQKPLVAPVIGITTYGCQETGNFYSPATYAKSIERCGGIPILLPPINNVCKFQPATLLDRLDGIIFAGGGDIDPVHYDGDGHPTIYNIDPDRDAAEIALAEYALNSPIPILGICRGLEILMVASGGKLIPHLPDEFGDDIAHRCQELKATKHLVQILQQTRLSSIVTVKEMMVVSWHHQAVCCPPPGWRLCAQAPDGVIEALESERHPWAIALQWHPELAPEDHSQQRIFEALIAATQNHPNVSLAG